VSCLFELAVTVVLVQVLSRVRVDSANDTPLAIAVEFQQRSRANVLSPLNLSEAVEGVADFVG
jgi:hypothetical protein